MNRLWVWLSVAFAVVTLIAVALVGVLVNHRANSEVRAFLTQEQVLDSGLAAQLTSYHATAGGWTGVETVFASFHSQGGSGAGGARGLKAAVFTLANGQSIVVYDESGNYSSQGGQNGGNGGIGQPHGAANAPSGAQRLSATDRSAAIPIPSPQSPIGYLVVRTPSNSILPAPAQSLLSQINRSLILAGLIAGVCGMLLGIMIARGLTSPLRRLARATRLISAGALDQRVPLSGPQEARQLAVAFNYMADSLQRSEQSRQQMVADVAHELRTPLSVIQGNLRALLDDVYPLEKREIATLYDETVLLSRLVSDLHDLTLAEADRLRMNVRPHALAPLIERTVALYQELAGEKNVSVSATLPEHAITILADAERTGQVLHNLLANALRHTPEGGRIVVQVEQVATPDDLPARPHEPGPQAWARISVTDTGQGLDATETPYVFERFWRADASRSRSQGGSGLGLAIAKALVEKQHGRIGVQSTPGEGSRFWFTLPVTTAAEEVPPLR